MANRVNSRISKSEDRSDYVWSHSVDVVEYRYHPSEESVRVRTHGFRKIISGKTVYGCDRWVGGAS